MKPYEFMRFFHPNLGRFVNKNKGDGIIVDNILKPMRSVVIFIGQNSCQTVSQNCTAIRYFARW